jgi:hypothetical protein
LFLEAIPEAALERFKEMLIHRDELFSWWDGRFGPSSAAPGARRRQQGKR